MSDNAERAARGIELIRLAGKLLHHDPLYYIGSTDALDEVAGDCIADILHGVMAQGGDPYYVHDKGKWHFDAEVREASEEVTE